MPQKNAVLIIEIKKIIANKILLMIFIQNQWKTADFLFSFYYRPQLSLVGQIHFQLNAIIVM